MAQPKPVGKEMLVNLLARLTGVRRADARAAWDEILDCVDLDLMARHKVTISNMFAVRLEPSPKTRHSRLTHHMYLTTSKTLTKEMRSLTRVFDLESVPKVNSVDNIDAVFETLDLMWSVYPRSELNVPIPLHWLAEIPNELHSLCNHFLRAIWMLLAYGYDVAVGDMFVIRHRVRRALPACKWNPAHTACLRITVTPRRLWLHTNFTKPEYR